MNWAILIIIVGAFFTAMFLILFKQNKVDEKDYWI